MPPKLVYYVRVWGRNARPTQDMGMPPQENTMNYATIKYCDIANGEGVRTSLFVSGCRRHCPNCFNAVAWDFGYGAPFTKEVRNEILESLAPGYINGLSLLGGEPFEPENQRELVTFVQNFKALYPKKTVWCYSGYTWEQLTGKVPCHARCEVTDELLLHRQQSGARDLATRSRAMRGHRRVFTIYRCACGRRLCAGPVRHQSALPRVEQPAHH